MSMSKANGPGCEGHSTTPYYTTEKSKGAQTNSDVRRTSSLKFTSTRDRPNFGNKSGGSKAPSPGGSGYRAGGRGVGGIKSDLPAKVKG
jgi:hypothetical protein